MLIQFARLSTNHTRAIVIGAVVFVVAGVLGGGVADHLTSGGFEDPSSEPERADEAPAEHFWHRWLTDVSMYALTLTTALGLGLAIDCSLFVVSRHREELRAGYATGTYRGTGSATQLGCEHGKLVLPPRCSPRLAGFNVDGATSPKVIPWDSGGRQ